MILNINRLDVRKRIDLAIRAFKELLSDIPDAYFVIGGKGSEQTKLEELISELGLQNRVKMVGFIPEEDLFDYYINCDVFIHPDWVDLDLALLEPLALGRKVVCSSEVERDEYLKELEDVRLFPAHPDVPSMKAALLRALRRETELQRPIEKILDTYTWENYAENLLAYLPNPQKKIRLAILASHPIEYQGPFFRKLAAEPEIDLHVYYCWKFGVGKETYDPGFNRKIQWDIPLLDGYSYSFLTNLSPKPSGKFFGEINPGIVRVVTKKKHDAFLILGWSSSTSWLLYLMAFIRGVPILIRGENPLFLEPKKSTWKRTVKKIILGFLFRRATAILPIGIENRKFYQYYGASDEKLFFAPYAVDNERFIAEYEKYQGTRAALKKELGIDSAKTAILFVGKLIPRKRPMDLIRAYEAVASNAALIYVGDGVLRPQLEIYAKEHNLSDIRFLGFRNQSKLPRLYSAADVFAITSDWETWGLVVNEAMCSGLPIVASDAVGCVPDLVQHESNGYIFDVGDIKSLTECLHNLVIDIEKRKKFGEHSLEIIKEYSYEKDIKGIKRALARVQ